MATAPDETQAHEKQNEKPARRSASKEEARSSSARLPKTLFAPSTRDWNVRSPKERQEYLDEVLLRFLSILNELVEEANLCVKIVKASAASHKRWRFWLILASGGLAILNLLAAAAAIESWRPYLSILAAIYAAILAILANLESHYNYGEKTQAYRESREMFLDAYREFEMLWHVHVVTFGDGPEACVNASEAYRLLVGRDRDLRGRLRELTETKKSGPAKQNV